MTENNIKGGFRGAGLVPFNPEAVISKLDVKLRTLTPTGPPDAINDAQVSQTPHNPIEAVSQTKFVRNRIASHQGSSPTPIFDAVTQLAKGVATLAHSVTLLTAENRSLQKANEALSKRRRAKKTRVRLGGSLTVGDAQDILLQKDIEEQIQQESRKSSGRQRGGQPSQQLCRNCKKPGHNARTCQKDEELSNVYSSDQIQLIVLVVVVYGS